MCNTRLCLRVGQCERDPRGGRAKDRCRARQPIETVHNDHVAAAEMIEQLRQFGTVAARARELPFIDPTAAGLPERGAHEARGSGRPSRPAHTRSPSLQPPRKNRRETVAIRDRILRRQNLSVRGAGPASRKISEFCDSPGGGVGIGSDRGECLLRPGPRIDRRFRCAHAVISPV